ncbi:MAG: peptidylprolyl isomerase [Planctomycetales bacterium]|nr:peptidylprolyl isomerase [Planctomycetales bacterium]
MSFLPSPARTKSRQRRVSHVGRIPRFESLEHRRLLTGLPLAAAYVLADAQEQATAGTAALVAEGEDAPDLVEFAKQLALTETKLFCAFWISDCALQRALFGDGGEFLPAIEVSNANGTINEIGSANQITQVPTWVFPDGTRSVGVANLETIATSSAVAIPTSSLPSMVSISDQTVAIGSPLHIPVDAYDPNGDALLVSVDVTDPSLLVAEVLSGNRSLRLDLADFGTMDFQLFERRAPQPANRVVELASSGFYDGVQFHRVVNDFVIQGGDPTGTGAGGSTLGAFDDQFHLELQHNAPGTLSYAKAGDDTNDSQFFITEKPLRFLDFNHSVFGILVEGERVREAISDIATIQETPAYDVVISKASIFQDDENSVLLLKALGNVTGSTEVTVTVRDPTGNASVQTFRVNVVADSFNAAPFLDPIENPATTINVPVEVHLTSQDKEGDAVTYSVTPVGDTEFQLTLDEAGTVTVNPPNGFSGVLQFMATVRPAPGTPTGAGARDDNQLVTVTVHSHQNPNNSLDVNDDGFVSPADVLIIVNFLNANVGSGAISELPPPLPFRNVNGDLFITPIDVLIIVNFLNANSDGEGEKRPRITETEEESIAPGLVDSLIARETDWLVNRRRRSYCDALIS